MMQNQNVRNPSNSDIRMGNEAAQQAASLSYYKAMVDDLQERIDQIVNVASAGETVTVFDQWGGSVTLSQHTNEPSE